MTFSDPNLSLIKQNLPWLYPIFISLQCDAASPYNFHARNRYVLRITHRSPEPAIKDASEFRKEPKALFHFKLRLTNLGRLEARRAVHR